MPYHRTLLAIAASAVLTLALPNSTFAQASDFPNRKITMVVGFAAGGGVDVLARIVAQELTDNAGYHIIIENRPGAGSNVAAKAVAGTTPDGYTLLFTGNSHAINQTIYKSAGYVTDDLRPIAIAAVDSQALAVNAGNPARTMSAFLEAAKTKPPSFGFGGSSSRIIADYVLRVLAKTQAVPVPFQSGAPAINALLGNHVDIISAPIAEVVPHIQQNAMRALAVTGTRRSHALPDVPMLSEAGVPGLEIHGWIGILAPAKVPDEIALKLNAAVNAAVAKPTVNARLRQLGYEPSQMALTDTVPFLKNSVETWRSMIQATGFTAE